MENCIFCKIVNKEISNYNVYEDENVLAFLDIHPHAKGHTVVIPKVHAETYFDLSDEQTRSFALGIKSTMQKIQDRLQPDGFNVGWNQKEAGGQVVPHLHVHIFPRWNEDGGGSMHAIIKAPGDTEVSEIAKIFT
jgi:histidine triad (HIT) family protein